MSQGRWRKRPNHELEYLRGKVADLEEELAVLRQSDERPALLMGDASEDGDDVAGRWKRIADRQSEEANAAVLENLKLRAMLEGQIQVARCLEAAIDQQQRKAAGALPWQSNGSGRSRATSLSDELLFGLLDENMESQYSEIDAVLKASGLTHVNKELLGKIEVQQDAHGVSFHTGEVRVLPFSVPSMLRAISKFLSHGSADGRMVRCHKLLQEGDYLHATTVVQLQVTRSRRVKVKSRLVQRRFSEPDREVIVWIAYVEIEGSVFVRLQERGWVSLAPFHFRRRGAPGSSSPGCIMRTVVRVMPEATEFESEDETQTHVGEMTDLVVGTYHRNFGLMYQVLENLLVSDAMSGAEADEAASSSA
ncbi:hypothetical protein BBJ28_00014260 [Nothophytophthora sp. Chile5]|nr:hypothetical protein BBJ28_00014260 [Nothophytophthora sp. Chile5]